MCHDMTLPPCSTHASDIERAIGSLGKEIMCLLRTCDDYRRQIHELTKQIDELRKEKVNP